MTPHIEGLFIAPREGASMQGLAEVWAVAAQGLAGDRYFSGMGHYSGRYDCQVTLIEGEALDCMEAVDGVRVHQGEHRRNLVTRGLALRELDGSRLQIGDVLLEFDRNRPPCSYVERLTQPGMVRALAKGAGIGMRVLESGLLQVGAPVTVLPIPGARPKRRLP